MIRSRSGGVPLSSTSTGRSFGPAAGGSGFWRVCMSFHKLRICCATMQDDAPNIDGWLAQSNTLHHMQDAVLWLNTPGHNDGVVGSYHGLYRGDTSEILCYLHDDVICREQDWDERVLAEFEDPQVGVVGFGGAKWHGTSDLYKTPYRLDQLRRGDYMSNVDDAEVNGARFTESTEVSVCDGFALVVRRDLLAQCDGWRGLASGCDFFCYDYALCAMARRLGYRIRCVGIRCHHLGGRTSVHLPDSEITSQAAYDRSHRWFYETYRDVMPARVP